MGGRIKSEIKLRIFCSDIMLNYQLSQKFKLLGNGKFNHLTISLTIIILGVTHICRQRVSKTKNKSGGIQNDDIFAI